MKMTSQQLKELRARKPGIEITQTVKRIIVGFDADVSACGVAMYDAAAGEVLEKECIKYRLMNEWLNDMSRDYDRDRFLVRIEIPTEKTAFGVVSVSRGSKGAFKTIYNSGRCRQIAEEMYELCLAKRIPVQRVDSDTRINFKSQGKSRAWLKTTTPGDFALRVVNLVRQGRVNDIYPTKVPAKFVKDWYGLPVAGNDEEKDALCLSVPEMAWRKYSNAIQYSR